MTISRIAKSISNGPLTPTQPLPISITTAPNPNVVTLRLPWDFNDYLKDNEPFRLRHVKDQEWELEHEG